MAGNQVTLTLAGDSSQLTRAFDQVGASAKQMETKVGETSSKFSRLGEATDNLDTKMSGATASFGALSSGIELVNLRGDRRIRDLQREIGAIDDQIGSLDKSSDAYESQRAALENQKKALEDQIKATEESQQKTEGLSTALMAGALAADTLSGIGQGLTLVLKSTVVQTALAKAGMVAHAVASGVARTATLAWTGVQWLLNAALTANPIGIIIVAIGALIAIIVLIATKTTWFQDIWNFVWNNAKESFNIVWGFLKGAWDWLGGAFNWLVDKFRSIPDMISNAFSNIWDIVTSPFRAAFNFIADIWNNTIGQLRWSVPSWVPFIGGNTISVPQLRHFHTGGVVPGAPGSEMLAVLQAGEKVTPAGQTANNAPIELHVFLDGREITASVRSNVKRDFGGNVQLALGR